MSSVLPLSRALAGAAVLLSVIAWGAASSTLVPATTSAIEQLKPGHGREQVFAHCMPCHSTAVIVASHQTREQWDQTITKMQKQNGMWAIAPTIRNQILDYLEASQPPSEPALEKAKESPWASPLYRPNPLWNQ